MSVCPVIKAWLFHSLWPWRARKMVVGVLLGMR
jgi:hypothetical protein